MKRVFLILATLCISAAAFAQEDGNRDENGKIVRGPYETNGFWDNWGIGVAGGVNVFGHRNIKPGVGIDAEINFSKWLTPCYGLRLGVQGLSARGSADQAYAPFFSTEKDGRYVDRLGFGYFHGDFLWSLTNAIWGYRESRVYNLVPYLHAGMQFSNNEEIWKNHAPTLKEFAMGVGFYNTFKVHKRLDITLDLRGIIVHGRAFGFDIEYPAYGLTAALGLNVNLGKTNWKRSAGVTPDQWKNANDALADANDALKKAKDDIAARDKALAEKDKELAQAKADAEAAKKEAAAKRNVLTDVEPATLYFNINESKLPVKERLHLDYYVKTILANVDANRTIVITGTADKNTGRLSSNKKLAEKRMNYIRDLLVNKYNIAPERIVTKSDVIKAKKGDEPLFRSIIIEL